MKERKSSTLKDREERWKRAAETFHKGDYAGALYLFKSLEKEGSTAALAVIGIIYELGGEEVEQDFIEAKKWYERSINEAEDVKAYMGLGRLYYSGLGVDRDYDKAYFYFSQLENENQPGALYILGKMYEKGQGTIQDIQIALNYYKKSADLGHAMALREWALLKVKTGDKLKGWFTLIRAYLRIFTIAFRDPEDWRLRVG